MLVAVAVLCVGLIALIVLPIRRNRAERPPRPARSPAVPPDGPAVGTLRRDEPVWEAGDDDLEIDEVFARVERENAPDVSLLVASRLDPLVRRCVPVRAVRAAPGRNSARICFADGTVVLARGRRPGGIAELALQVHRHTVCMESWTREADVTTMNLRWAPRGGVAVVAVGLDQAD